MQQFSLPITHRALLKPPRRSVSKILPSQLRRRRHLFASTSADRFSQVVSVVSVVGLLCTVVFSYLSWRESRSAREDLTAAFLAEKAPQVKVAAAHVFYGTLMADLQNTGESVALNVSAVAVHESRFLDSPSSSRPAGARSVPSLRKAQSVTLAVTTSETVRAFLSNRTGDLIPLSVAGLAKGSSDRLLVLVVSYEDAYRNKHEELFEFVAPSE